jgi:hypothetical protein
VIETREEAIRVLLSPEYAEFTSVAWKQELADVSGRTVYADDIKAGKYLPYKVIGIAEGFTPDPNYGKTKLVDVPADAPTDRWLDAGDAMEKGTIDDNAIYCIRIKGAAMPTFVYGHDLVNQCTFTLDMVQGIKPYSWITNPKSPEALADAKRFAGVKTWEGGKDA